MSNALFIRCVPLSSNNNTVNIDAHNEFCDFRLSNSLDEYVPTLYVLFDCKTSPHASVEFLIGLLQNLPSTHD